MLSLEEEFSRRQELPANPTSVEVKSCIEKLRNGMTTLEVTERLEDHTHLVSAAAEILRRETTNRRDRIYKQFLEDILIQCGHAPVILCSWKIGKRRIAELKHSERIELLDYLKKNLHSFEHHVLHTIATKHKIGNTARGSVNTITTVAPPAIERRKLSTLSSSRGELTFSGRRN